MSGESPSHRDYQLLNAFIASMPPDIPHSVAPPLTLTSSSSQSLVAGTEVMQESVEQEIAAMAISPLRPLRKRKASRKSLANSGFGDDSSDSDTDSRGQTMSTRATPASTSQPLFVPIQFGRPPDATVRQSPRLRANITPGSDVFKDPIAAALLSGKPPPSAPHQAHSSQVPNLANLAPLFDKTQRPNDLRINQKSGIPDIEFEQLPYDLLTALPPNDKSFPRDKTNYVFSDRQNIFRNATTKNPYTYYQKETMEELDVIYFNCVASPGPYWGVVVAVGGFFQHPTILGRSPARTPNHLRPVLGIDGRVPRWADKSWDVIRIAEGSSKPRKRTKVRDSPMDLSYDDLEVSALPEDQFGNGDEGSIIMSDVEDMIGASNLMASDRYTALLTRHQPVRLSTTEEPRVHESITVTRSTRPEPRDVSEPATSSDEIASPSFDTPEQPSSRNLCATHPQLIVTLRYRRPVRISEPLVATRDPNVDPAATADQAGRQLHPTEEDRRQHDPADISPLIHAPTPTSSGMAVAERTTQRALEQIVAQGRSIAEPIEIVEDPVEIKIEKDGPRIDLDVALDQKSINGNMQRRTPGAFLQQIPRAHFAPVAANNIAVGPSARTSREGVEVHFSFIDDFGNEVDSQPWRVCDDVESLFGYAVAADLIESSKQKVPIIATLPRSGGRKKIMKGAEDQYAALCTLINAAPGETQPDGQTVVRVEIRAT